MYVYISGPYTAPDPVDNARRAILAADRVRDAGAHPFLPHLFLLWHVVSPASYKEWLKLCLAWVPMCNVLVRLPGESPGADIEVALAMERGIPVFQGVDDFLHFFSRGGSA